MAIPVEFREFTPKNSRNDLMRRLEQVPDQHAEALLAAYDLLQRMHEKGLIDIASGLLSASDTVMDKVADVASSTEVVNALRAVLMFTNLLKTLDMERMHVLISAPESKPPSLWALGRQAMSKDARVGLATGVGLLNLFGSALRKQHAA